MHRIYLGLLTTSYALAIASFTMQKMLVSWDSNAAVMYPPDLLRQFPYIREYANSHLLINSAL